MTGLYGKRFSDFGEIPIPSRNSVAYRIFYKFMDYELIHKFLAKAQSRYPSLSMEVRVDSDPIYQPGHNTPISWQSHHLTYALKGTGYTTIYYSPSMGAKNNSDFEPVSTALNMLNDSLSDILKYSGGNKIFIDQFLFTDNTPGFKGNTKIYPNKINAYLINSAKYLNKYTRGYAIWAYRDYEANAVYNPSFAEGTQGWTVSGSVIKTKNGVLLADGTTLAQKIAKSRDHYYQYRDKETVSFLAKSPKNMSLIVTLGDKLETTIKVKKGRRLYHFDEPLSELHNLDIKFNAAAGEVEISQVEIYSFIQKGGVRGTSLAPERYLKGIKGLNALLLNGHLKYTKSFDPNIDWHHMLTPSQDVLKGSYQIEGKPGHRYVWIGRSASINLWDSVLNNVEVKGYIPVSKIEAANPDSPDASVKFLINGKVVLDKTFVKDGRFDVIISKAKIKNMIGKSKSFIFGIKPSGDFIPAEIGEGVDKRGLSVLINYVGVVVN